MALNDKQEIDNRRLDKIKFEILQLEDENAKTKDCTQNEMVEKIKQAIKSGVDGKL